MKQWLLSKQEVLTAYDAVSQLYPHIPPMTAWRSWEMAGYRHFALPEPVLDVGCGDGRYFRLVWPGVRDVAGVDIDRATLDRAAAGGVYRDLRLAPAHALPFAAESFASAFANCSMEHMDDIDGVLRAVHRALRPGGQFLFSVVNDKYVQWSMLPFLVTKLGDGEWGRRLQAEHDEYHHLRNPFADREWAARLAAAGFECVEHVPIVPELTARLVLLLDQLWHVPDRSPGGTELGLPIHHYVQQFPNFVGGYREVLGGILAMEKDPAVGAGSIFCARRPA